MCLNLVIFIITAAVLDIKVIMSEHVPGHLYPSSKLDGEDRPDLFGFVTNGILLCSIGTIGFFGNVISMIILSSPRMRSAMSVILVGLAGFDSVLVVTSVLVFGIPCIYQYTDLFSNYFWHTFPKIAPYVYPLALIAQTGSVYLTLAVSLERFVAVCHPLKANALCAYGRALLYVTVVSIFSILQNIPRFLETTQTEDLHPTLNTTVYRILPSTLRMNNLYIQIYINWWYLFVMFVIPFACLAIFNIAIFLKVRSATRDHENLSQVQEREMGLATMLLCVVVVFFVCNILALVNNVLESFEGIMIVEMVQVSNLLVTLNSSINFVIYVIFRDKFQALVSLAAI